MHSILTTYETQPQIVHLKVKMFNLIASKWHISEVQKMFWCRYQNCWHLWFGSFNFYETQPKIVHLKVRIWSVLHLRNTYPKGCSITIEENIFIYSNCQIFLELRYVLLRCNKHQKFHLWIFCLHKQTYGAWHGQTLV